MENKENRIVEFAMLAVNVLFVASLWYLRVAIPKAIGQRHAKELESLRKQNAKELEWLKGFLDGQQVRNRLLAEKRLSLYDEILTVSGEFKTLGFAQMIGFNPVDPNQGRDWLHERMYRLELFAQTWWPYLGEELRDRVVDFRKAVEEAATQDPGANRTTIEVGSFFDAADRLQEVARRDLDERFGIGAALESRAALAELPRGQRRASV